MAEPMYRQIAEDLRGRIESGELPGGSRLPTELELQEQFGASRNTGTEAHHGRSDRASPADDALPGPEHRGGRGGPGR